MPTRRLPSNPDLDHLKHQSRDLLKLVRVADERALLIVKEFHPRYARAQMGEVAEAFTLADAYFSVARHYGFRSWSRLVAFVRGGLAPSLERPHHERITDSMFRRAVDLADDGDADGLRAYLDTHPSVATQRIEFEGENYFTRPSLLEFVAENPVRHGATPPNVATVADVILTAGADRDMDAVNSTLRLVVSGRVPRECGTQRPLVNLLCDAGAEPSGAMHASLSHGEFDAAAALVERGATLGLAGAAALGRLDEVQRIGAGSSPADRHLALAWAVQFGHIEIVRVLLDLGVDPARYNPANAHAHSTPLHQAAVAGHLDLVRLLTERGADLSARDTVYDGTPLEWAEHADQAAVVAYLRAEMRGQNR
jgi:hypothetical protein